MSETGWFWFYGEYHSDFLLCYTFNLQLFCYTSDLEFLLHHRFAMVHFGKYWICNCSFFYIEQNGWSSSQIQEAQTQKSNWKYLVSVQCTSSKKNKWKLKQLQPFLLLFINIENQPVLTLLDKFKWHIYFFILKSSLQFPDTSWTHANLDLIPFLILQHI